MLISSRVRPPCARHGVPERFIVLAAEALQGAGWKEVFAHIQKGTAHGIAPDGLSVALAFLRDKCGF